MKAQLVIALLLVALAACHHPLNVDAAALRRAEVAPGTPRASDQSALPRDSSGSSHPVSGGTGDPRRAPGST